MLTATVLMTSQYLHFHNQIPMTCAVTNYLNQLAPSAAEGSKSERLPCAVSSPCILLYLRMLHQWWKVKQGTAKCTDTPMLFAEIVDESQQQNVQWKKCSEETQTLRAGCSKAEPKKLAPPQTPSWGWRDGQNLISWRWSLPLPTNPVRWGSMHAISSYRGNRPTNNTLHR